MREHGLDKQHLVWISKLWEQGHFESKTIITTRSFPEGAPESPMVFKLLVDTVQAALNKQWWDKGK